MNRRAFIVTLAVGLLAAPLAAEAQSGKVFRVGILATGSSTDPSSVHVLGAFFQRLRELGYVEGQNLAVERRFAEGKYERFPDLAADLVRLKVDIIVAAGGLSPFAAQRATKTIPIVMTNQADPVGSGLVASLARPGGNITGLSLLISKIVGKQLELFKEVIPKVSRVDARIMAQFLRCLDSASRRAQSGFSPSQPHVFTHSLPRRPRNDCGQSNGGILPAALAPSVGPGPVT